MSSVVTDKLYERTNTCESKEAVETESLLETHFHFFLENEFSVQYSER